ncbi:MAG: hypothetical protein ACFCU6_05275 [Balneolaceae bacterium]
MTSWMIFIIVIAAIISGFFLEYKSKEKKFKGINNQYENEFNEMRTLIQQLKKRIENLEAIAAVEPDEFKSASKKYQKIEVDESASEKEKNERKVSDLANKKMENYDG